MKLKYRSSYIYIAIIMLQVLVLLYWAHIKTNYYIDELYSMGYASSFTGEGETARYITTSPDFHFNRWIENSAFKKYLLISNDEKVFNASPFKVVQKFITDRNYFGFLNMAESVAGYSSVSAGPGVLLNIVFFVLAEISQISLMKKLNIDERVRFLSVAMFGFSCYVISAAEFIRFYMMAIMLAFMMLNSFHKLWSANAWREIIGAEIIITIIAYFAYKNSELTIPFFVGLMGCFIVASYLKKRRRHLFSCITLCVCGVIYIALSSDYIGILLHPNNYPATTSVAVSASLKISKATFNTFCDFIMWLKNLLENNYLGRYWVLYLLICTVTIYFATVRSESSERRVASFKFKDMRFGTIWALVALALICVVSYKLKQGEFLYFLIGAVAIFWLVARSENFEKRIVSFKLKDIRFGTIVAFVVWALICVASHKVKQGEFLCTIILSLIALLGMGEAIGYKFSIKKMELSSDSIFIIILIGATVFYSVFFTMCGYTGTWRYYYYGFVSITVLIWFMIDRILKISYLQQRKNTLIIILTFFVTLNAFIPFKTRNIHYMYANEKDYINKVTNNSKLNVVMFLALDENGMISRHETYDCINLMPDDSKIYMVDLEKYDYDQVDYPDEFLLWSHKSRDLTAILDDLSLHGYELQKLGSDHCSKAYVCRL